MKKYKQGLATTLGFLGGSLIGYFLGHFERGMAIGLAIGALIDLHFIRQSEE